MPATELCGETGEGEWGGIVSVKALPKARFLSNICERVVQSDCSGRESGVGAVVGTPESEMMAEVGLRMRSAPPY